MMAKARPTHMRPVLEAAIASGELALSTRKASNWALTTIDDLTARLAAAEAAVEIAWGIIANAGEGDWTKESVNWQVAAERFRDKHWNQMVKQVYARYEAAKGGRDEI